MAAPSDSSSDPTARQSLGASAVGAHAAPESAVGGAADRPAASHQPATPDRTVAIDRVAPGGSNDTTTAQPVVERTPTTPVAPPAPAPGRGAPRMDRQQVVAAQKARYGGISWGAAFFGWLSANGMAVILIALLSAAGLAFGLSDTVASPGAAATSATSGIGLGAGIALLVALFLAYLAGGYVAGRMSRFDGVKQGVAVWVIGLLVVLLLALAGLVFGSQYNVLSQLNLPRIPIDEGTATTAGMIALAAVLVATLIGAILGGILGTRYHRKVDRVGFDAV
jgi:membrane protease YdiL (CAAX protease family)